MDMMGHVSFGGGSEPRNGKPTGKQPPGAVKTAGQIRPSRWPGAGAARGVNSWGMGPGYECLDGDEKLATYTGDFLAAK